MKPTKTKKLWNGQYTAKNSMSWNGHQNFQQKERIKYCFRQRTEKMNLLTDSKRKKRWTDSRIAKETKDELIQGLQKKRWTYWKTAKDELIQRQQKETKDEHQRNFKGLIEWKM